MPEISKRLSFVFTIAIATVYAGCGGPPQTEQAGFPQQILHRATLQTRVDAASTPLPRNAVSHRAPRPLARYPQTGQPLLYFGDGSHDAIDIFPLTGPNQKQVGSISNDIFGPWGVSIDADNSLYVANSSNANVTVYPYGSTSPSMTYSNGVHEPLYALADSAGHVFVSGRNPGSHNKGEVYEYNAGSNVPIAHSRLYAEADGMAVDGKGNLYVAYRRTGPNCGIAEFGAGLSNKRLLGMIIDQPQGLVIDKAGNLVVVESAYNRIKVFPPGAKTPSVTITLDGIGNLAELAMQSSETTLWVSSEGGYVYSMPYPLTPSTVPSEYENTSDFSNGFAVSPH